MSTHYPTLDEHPDFEARALEDFQEVASRWALDGGDVLSRLRRWWRVVMLAPMDDQVRVMLYQAEVAWDGLALPDRNRAGLLRMIRLYGADHPERALRMVAVGLGAPTGQGRNRVALVLLGALGVLVCAPLTVLLVWWL